MTKHTMGRAAAILIAFATVFAYTGCKESAILNTNITPAGDSLIVEGEDVPFDVRMVMSSFVTSQALTDGSVIMGAGLISDDPEFGSTDASVFFQVVPLQSNGYTLPAGNLIDSVVLVLPYSGFTFGDTGSAQPLDYKVYVMTEGMAKSDVLFNDNNKATESTPVGAVTLQYASLRDSINIEGKKVMPHLRIPLDTSALLGKIRSANNSSYLDFVNSFKGLQVKTTSTTGNIVPYYRLTDDAAGTSVSKAGIVIYHHDVNTGELKYDVIGYNPDATAHFNRIQYALKPGIDTANYAILQSRPGLSLELTTKNVASLSTRIVNKAEIVISEVVDNNQMRDKYVAPGFLFPFVVDDSVSSDGHELLTNVADAVFTSSTGAQVSGFAFISGASKKLKSNGVEYNQYTINIPKEFQKALRDKKEMKLRITGLPNGFPGAYRLKAGKNNQSDPFRIRLNVVYSKL